MMMAIVERGRLNEITNLLYLTVTRAHFFHFHVHVGLTFQNFLHFYIPELMKYLPFHIAAGLGYSEASQR